MKITYGYKILQYDDEIIDYVGAHLNDGEYVAKLAAEDFHSNHDGWECSWPLEFVILREDGSEVGRYLVERDVEPVFYASRVKETACTPTN